MKKILSVIAIAAIFATSCNSAANREKEAQQKELDSLKMEMARQHIIDSMNEVAVEKAKAEGSKTVVVYNKQGEPEQHYINASQPTASGEPTKEKKGWSAKAKGAVIGAGVGAVTGAAVSKTQKGKGAIIGGAVGAAAGTGVGAIIDEKEGR